MCICVDWGYRQSTILKTAITRHSYLIGFSHFRVTFPEIGEFRISAYLLHTRMYNVPGLATN